MFAPRLTLKSSYWPLLLAVVFLLHALTYHYFFVDDEGITLVYADNLLDGHGLTYAASDGRSEGYSNFLHVFTMTALLAVTNAAGLPRIQVFDLGGAFSLMCGTMLVVLAWRTARRLELPTAACVTAAALVSLSVPLAVWSNSSLETTPFALALFVLMSSTLPVVASPRATALAAVVVLLLRIDGLLFVGAWLGARLIAGDAATRAVVLRRIVPVVAVAAAGYFGWRVWYFGEWLTLPLQTKVAHKLVDAGAVVVWRDGAGYLVPFLRSAGWPLLPGVLALGLVWRQRGNARAAVWSCGLALAVLIAYVSVVGDWMFGFRFFAPLVAPLALLCAFVVASVERRVPRLGVVVAVMLAGAATLAAARFTRTYEVSQQRPAFWREPSATAALRFGEYHDVWRVAAPLVPPGERIAFHDAGFVPFMLDVENVDMLGLTSPFVGGLPSRDAVFTDVGRYYPLTQEPAHHAVHAYLVHRAPALVIVRQSWMRRANGARLPAVILGGHYRLAAETTSFAVYRREAGVLEAGDFLENLAHPAYAEAVAVNGRPVPLAAAAARLPSLWQGGGHEVDVAPRWTLHVDPEEDASVHEVYLAGSAPSEDLNVDVVLRDEAGVPTERLSAVVPAGTPLQFSRALEDPAVVGAADIRVTSVSGRATQFVLTAVRVMGQTGELRDHLIEHGVIDGGD